MVINKVFLHVLPWLGSIALLLFACRGGRSVVTFYNTIPPLCNTVRGLKQKKIIPVHNEKQLRKHYGLTFRIRFNDKVSPTLYGALYYQDDANNLYCMALPNGRFALFRDSKIGRRKNIIQEVCYPIQEC